MRAEEHSSALSALLGTPDPVSGALTHRHFKINRRMYAKTRIIFGQEENRANIFNGVAEIAA